MTRDDNRILDTFISRGVGLVAAAPESCVCSFTIQNQQRKTASGRFYPPKVDILAVALERLRA